MRVEVRRHKTCGNATNPVATHFEMGAGVIGADEKLNRKSFFLKIKFLSSKKIKKAKNRI